MVMDIETAGALVPGRNIKKEVSVETQKVKILRTFRDGKTELLKDAILTIPKWLAVQAKDANKVEFLEEAKPEETKAGIFEALKEEEPKPEVRAEVTEEPKPDHKKSKKG